MALSRSNPISVEVLESAPVDDLQGELKRQVEELMNEVRRVDSDQIGWMRKQAELTKLRLGVRRPRSIPWRGASNISIPLIDGLIRRWRPGIVALMLDAEPVAFFTPQSQEDFDPARTVEPFFSYLFREAMETTFAAIQLVDLIAWRGHAYTREAWNYRTRNQSRVITTAHLFPAGLQETIQAMQQQAAEQGQELKAEEIVMGAIEQEYGLTRTDQAEAIALTEAVVKILQGAEYVKLTYRTILTDRPDWTAIDPVQVITPQDENPEEADFFVIIHEMSQDTLKSMATDGHLRPNVVAEFLKKDSPIDPGHGGGSKSGHSMRQEIKDLMDRKAGHQTSRQGRQDNGMFEVWEIYCHLDVKGSGERERCILWYAPNAEMALGIMDYPYPFKGWPITYFPFEGAKRPTDNRGLADMTRSFQKVINAFHNARLDAAQIVLAPVLLRKVTSGNMNKAVKWHPGATIPVASAGDITMLQKGAEGMSILNGLLQEEQVNQRMAEAYVGVFDASLTNLQESRERRTAAEVNAIQSLSGNIFGLDAKIFATSLSRSFNKVWQLYEDLGPQEMFFRVTGEEKPRLAIKREIVHNYDIRAAGTPANTNRSFQIQNMERIMQVMMNPLVVQSGRVDFIQAFEHWLKLVDYNVAKGVLRSPEDAAAVQQILQAQAAVQEQQGQPPAPNAF